ncbi:substrate-binding domain-containing protein [Limimaricola variabilis]
MSTTRLALWSATMLTATALPLFAQDGSNIGDVDHPLWYQPPSAETLELAKIDDLSDTVVSGGPRGEEGVLASTLNITEEQAQKIRDGKFTAAISMGWLGDDWATQQLIGLNETFEKLGIEVVAETNANWDDAKQLADLDAIAVLKPDLVVSIPLNTQTTASAFQSLAEAGSEIVFIDQAADGMDAPGDYAGVVSSDNLALGMYLADLLAERNGGTGEVGAMYFANDFYVTNLRYIGFVARLTAKYPDMKLIAAAGHDDPNKGQQVAQAMIARYPAMQGLYASWSIPAMGAVAAAQSYGRTPQDLPIVNENFDQIVAADMANDGFIAGISSQRPYDQGVAEATIGALALIGEDVPDYVVVPPLKVSRDNLPASYETIYRLPLPEQMAANLGQ